MIQWNLRVLFEDFTDENNANKNIQKHKLLYKEFQDKKTIYNEFKSYFEKRENSFINKLFDLDVINIFSFSCGYDSYTVDVLIDIPFLLPPDNEQINLDH